MLMLTQLGTVKGRLFADSFDISDDTALTNFILACSGRFELETNRKFERTVDDTFEFPADYYEILPARYPVESITTIHLKSNETEGWVEQTGYDFLIRGGGARVSLTAPIGSCSQVARLTYTAGYVLPGYVPQAGQTALPDEIDQACVEQVCYWFQNRTRLGVVSMSSEGGSISQFAQLDLLPHVRAVLRRYERLIL